ncbi:glutamyl-tRNA synthetase [Catalinimonas alkaloidigena]|uniref:glutamate--tRNA ligase n=1 Tax=Catalinimonas alkaloidigena TaxID=1075417 RepID=UPI0024052FAF|nr:glutamate--tRNA ligase [Catalinimonas alkaloidigena]MDF9800418.1 glutamyl-tRNA synthetase [Catalinimonas alkaloidigena]
MEQNIRVRFAPSPTGPQHIGGIRTALYNYLFARQKKGTFILRIEDTDQTRYVPCSEDYLKKALKWCGIQPDEGVDEGGPYAPYRQSERKEIYGKYAQQLIDAGHAYYAFDTEVELNEMRERLKDARVAQPQYNAITRMTMKNSLTLSESEVKAKMDAGEPYVIRLKVPRKDEVRLNDMVRGWIMVHSSTLDDKVIMKSDGMPTYHLANVVDDHLMEITHVIRGEEWLPSAPLHVLMYQFLGWEESMPQFAHLPLLLKPDGNGKLSKRDSLKHGFPVFPMEWTDDEKNQLPGFKEEGYLPEAFINFLAFLGWNPGTEQELFTKEELIEAFKIENINKAGARFDIHKAQWYNQQYLRQKSDDELAGMLLSTLEKAGVESSRDKAVKVSGLMKERVTFPAEIWENAKFFYVAPQRYDEKIVNKKWTEEATTVLQAYANALKQHDGALNADQAKIVLEQVLNELEVKMGRVMQALRLAVTGEGSGPDLMPTIEVLGRDETANRIENALQKLEMHVKT